jgi:hypothetical protein
LKRKILAIFGKNINRMVEGAKKVYGTIDLGKALNIP